MSLVVSVWQQQLEDVRLLANALAPGQVRIVGGAVRDYLLGNAPHDIDLATPLLPQKVSEKLGRAGITALPTGIEHGTVTALVAGKTYEITTLRRDTQTDGRHATVTFCTSWQQDAARRDFTFNALYMDTHEKITDFYNGTADLSNGVVRFIGDAKLRIQEDYLRILRFFRFWAWYGRALPDAQTLQAIRQQADGLQTLAAERITAELLKLLGAPQAAQALQHMTDCTLWSALSLPAPDLLPVVQLQQAEVPLITPEPLTHALMLWGENIMNASTLRWSRAQQKEAHGILQAAAQLAAGASPAALLYHYGRHSALQAALLAMGTHGFKASKDVVEQLQTLELPVFPLTGQDVLDAGLPPGPQVGTLLQQLVQVWLQNGTPPRAEMLCQLEVLVSACAAGDNKTQQQ